MPKPRTKKPKPGFEPGPLARTIAEIAAGPLCKICGRRDMRGDHEHLK